MGINENEHSNIIDARPTKDFFIHMLVKDIELTRAIIDLVDNCLDGALRIRQDGNFDGLYVRLEVNPNRFRIVDNCGGISIDIARSYAFRFGRPAGEPSTPHSVGQFGVGMKRALFKLGSRFTVVSTTENSRFVINQDVNEWKRLDQWEFRFDELEENLVNVPPDRRGTSIQVEPLHSNIQEDFGLENFINKLRKEIRLAHQHAIEKGLAISVNGIPLEADPLKLLNSDEMKPAFYEETINQDGGSVFVKIYAGIAESDSSKAGWYLYCNGRMVLGADQTNITGWGEGGEITIPKYHGQFDRFRGYTFFDSDDASLLPWNTTKTGVDLDSPIYRSMRQKMVTLMRPVIDFLNKLHREKSEETDDKPLATAVYSATSSALSTVQTSLAFESPKIISRPKLPRLGRITYNKPIDQIEKAKKVLKVTTHKMLGEKTFDYFYDRECEE